MPDSITMNKEKIGFNASITSLVDIKCEDFREWLFSESEIFEIVDKANLQGFLDKDFSKNEFSKFLFSFISAKIFIDSSKKNIDNC